ncbi:hypothetical protein [Qipengyuania sp.]|uniref:hypothetical protein n=1 Tax=Qipengyuania sp. TaxID=2004515 RepID=UPI0037354DF7
MMPRTVPISLVLGAFCLPTAALAQDQETDRMPAPEVSASIKAHLSDPARQAQLARTLRVLGEVMLDLPLAPLADAAAQIAGEDGPAIPPGTTLRSMAPEASRLPELAERATPRALDALAALAETLDAMAPALRDLSAQLEDTAPPPPR